MAVINIKENVYSVGAIHSDRQLFDEVIPLPDGTSYNSYLIIGSEKTALIDTVDPDKKSVLFENLDALNPGDIHYIIANHAEQDHSGSIPYMLKKYPGARVVTNEKCKGILKDLLLIPEEKFLTVKDGETLSLGDKTLEFYLTPWVHWPETQVTYLKEDGILFSCDFFGSHVASTDITKTDTDLNHAKRYFAEIMAPFRNNVLNNIKKIEPLDIKIIAPSHGNVHMKPEAIRAAYAEWAAETVKNEVTIAYVSMHHSTKKMADYLLDALVKRGITVRFFNLTIADVGNLAMSLIDSATIVVGTPNFLAGAHPVAVNAVYLANALRPKAKFASVFVSYSWAERATEQIKSMLTNFKGELIKPVAVKGFPKEADLKDLDRLADEILEKHKSLGLM